ncbi:MAG: SusC/RagA family TonB-linked outer membrane protein [Flavisolibacter sp.]
MHSVAHGKRHLSYRRTTRARRACNVLLLCSTLLAFSFPTSAQSISLSLEKASLETAIHQIQSQSPYQFVYTSETIQKAKPVSLHIKNVTIDTALSKLFEWQPLSYSIDNYYIMLKEKQPKISSVPAMDISGIVTDPQGLPIEAASVVVKGTTQATQTDQKGNFHLQNLSPGIHLLITSIGFQGQEILVNHQTFLSVQLAVLVSKLDESMVIAYGTTTKRLSTGSVSKLSAEQISTQPVSNPLQALQGRITGLWISQSSGLPGSSINVLLRGQNSIAQGNQPLYIVDGIPFMLNSGSLSQVSSATISQSPLNTINPEDIASIEVLKDADATALYGSQGANGVILITTKKGKAGKTTVGLHYYTGRGVVSRQVPLLHTQEYLQMRKEAFSNDGVVPTQSSAADLFLWDSTRYTDWSQQLIGGTASIQNIQATLSGGSDQTQFLFSTNYYTESTVFPEHLPYRRGTGRLNITHNSQDKRFTSLFSTAYSIDEKRFPLNDLTSYIFLPPNAPALYDSAGNINWNNWVTGVNNPMAQLLNRYTSQTNNLLCNSVLGYHITKQFFLHINLGYNLLTLDEQREEPIKAQRPSPTTSGSARIANTTLKGWTIEPQLDYQKYFGKTVFSVLAGASLQERTQKRSFIIGSQFKNDDLLGSIASAGTLQAGNNFSDYRYQALFSRINLNWNGQLILNINARRDGSSRFGPANRFSNFGAIGGAWIFSREQKKLLPFLSYGKIRGSYGVTGNDQIGDYQYLDAWSSSSVYQYGGNAGILPVNLYNPYFTWERNKKLEAALELGFFQDKLLVDASYYRNRSDNQLVPYRLPSQTGFTTILKNSDALVQNSGWEVELSAKNFLRGKLNWQVSANISFPRNLLLRYPGLDNSAYKYTYVAGQPLNIIHNFTYQAVDPAKGIYQFKDVDGNGLISSPADLSSMSFLGQRFFGGLDNNLHWGNFQLDLFFQFVRQTGLNYISALSAVPGSLSNQPFFVLDRWTKPGMLTDIEKFTASATSATANSFANRQNSSAIISDASFIRLKNLYCSYDLPQAWKIAIRAEELKIFIEGENLFILTSYKGADPETQQLSTLPTLRVWSAGIHLTF